MTAESTTAAVSKLSGADRVLAILKLLGDHPSGIALDDLTRLSGVPKSSVHRALAALRRAGFVEQAGPGGRYRLGPELVRVAFSFYEGLDERVLVQPVLDELATRFRETIHYARLDAPEVVYVAKMTPQDRQVQMTSRVGGRNPAHCTGVGKALLAQALADDEDVARYVMEHGPLERRTASTIVEASALAQDLASTKERGYALDREESEVGVVCIAFPVELGLPALGPSAVSISALAFRTDLDALIAAAPEIKAIIAGLSPRAVR
jgi:DNA-binding IclR family transcriptional regulator